jgi:hypothetical protein
VEPYAAFVNYLKLIHQLNNAFKTSLIYPSYNITETNYSIIQPYMIPNFYDVLSLIEKVKLKL